MELPEILKTHLERLLAQAQPKQLAEASSQLSEAYRQLGKQAAIAFKTPTHRLAYLAVRLPATYAAIARVLQELLRQAPHLHLTSMLDVGSGPGTALWAAHELFTSIQSFISIERDGEMIALAKRLAAFQVDWIQGDVLKQPSQKPADLVTMAYLLGELPEQEVLSLIDHSWVATQQALVVIEPGTPRGFETIRKVRGHLISQGAHLAAPCPHHLACPMAGSDWCHFAVRLERSVLHRYVKEGTLGYEDEKFSYVIALKKPVPVPEARIVRHPQKRSGHIHFRLCVNDGELHDRVISRKQGELFSASKKLNWGDAFK
jgi:ribosomal protein RSM22 (predicted rRNA methylase)